MGIVDIYLDRNCASKTYKLCLYKDSLPNNFLWNESSPIKKTGGWELNSQEYSLIVKDLASQPNYLKMLIFKSTIYTVKQFFNFDMVDIWVPSERINNAIKTYYPKEFPQHMKTMETNNLLKIGFLNYVQLIVIGLSITIYFNNLLISKNYNRIHLLILLVIVFFIANCWVCGTFSGVFPRYQLRVIWILVLPIFLYVCNFKRLRYNKLKINLMNNSR